MSGAGAERAAQAAAAAGSTSRQARAPGALAALGVLAQVDPAASRGGGHGEQRRCCRDSLFGSEAVARWPNLSSCRFLLSAVRHDIVPSVRPAACCESVCGGASGAGRSDGGSKEGRGKGSTAIAPQARVLGRALQQGTLSWQRAPSSLAAKSPACILLAVWRDRKFQASPTFGVLPSASAQPCSNTRWPVRAQA